MSRLLSTIFVLALLAAGCSAAETDDAAAEPDTTPSSTAPASTLPPRIDVEPIDPAEAIDVASLLVAGGGTGSGMAMEPGAYYAGKFSTPILFDLPVNAQIEDAQPSWVVILVGDDPDNWSSTLQIIEPVAYVGEDGPIPIGEVAPDEAWGGATKLDSGVVESTNGTITWVDVVFESENIAESRTYQCGFDDTLSCTHGLVGGRQNFTVELDRPHRYATVERDGTRFVVASTSPWSGDTAAHQQLPLDVAASLMLTSARESGGDLQELVTAGSTLPAGTWSGELEGSTFTLTLEEDLEGLQLNGGLPRDVVFSSNDGAVVFYVFEGFVDGVEVRPLTTGEPLTNDEYFGALDQIFGETVREEVTIGGLSAVRYVLGDDHNPAFACPDELLSGRSTDVPCSIWGDSNFGPLGYDSESLANYDDFYIEEIGLYISLPVGEADPDGLFAQVLSSIELTPAP